jgi:tripartite-type tricarboxylate transporter receptor subunit TctC
MLKGKKWCRLILLSLIFLLITQSVEKAQSQDKFPTKPIDIIVPYGPGGGTDVVIRVVAAYLNKKWHVPVNVINKAGGNTIPARLEVFRSSPDGYTVLGDNESGSMLGVTEKNLPFTTMDRTFICIVTTAPFCMFVHAPLPYKNLADLIGEVKKDPGNFTWTSLGGASPQDFVARQFFKAIDVNISATKPIMCKSGSEAATLAAGGHAKMGISTTSSSLPTITGGLTRALAVTGKMRYPDLPNTPSTAELGYPSMSHVFWVGISGPPKMPSHIVAIWEKALQELIKEPEFISKLRNVGALPDYHNSKAAEEFVKGEVKEVTILWGLK